MKVNAREKKILYAGIVIAAAIMIYYGATLFSPGDGESLADKVATQENLLRRYKELIAREESYKKQIEFAETDIEKIRARLLPGNTATSAGMELQRILDGFAEQSGVLITNKSPQPERKVTDSDSLTKISVRVQLDCRIEDLVDFLIAIKNYDKFLRVEDIVINTQTSTQTRQMIIRRPLSMVIAGYISVPPPEPTAKSGENAAQTTAERYVR